MMTKHKMNGTQAEVKIISLLIAMVMSCGILLAPPLIAEVTATHDVKPVAVIDGTLKVSVGETVYLDGTFSSNPGGSALTFRWTLVDHPEGSVATISDSATAHAKFNADVAGTYIVGLVVNNGLVDSDPAYAAVIVTPKP